MPLQFVMRTCCLAGILALCSVTAAERKPSPVGLTRDQVIAQFGEPKSNIVAGNREVLFFTGERVVLRDGRVIEADEIPVETPPRPAPEPAADTATAPASNSAAASTAPDAAVPGTASTAGDRDATAAAPPPPAPEAIIKSIRPPSRTVDRATESTAAEPTPAANSIAPATTATVTPPAPVANQTPVAPQTSEPAATASPSGAPATPATATTAASTAPMAVETAAAPLPSTAASSTSDTAAAVVSSAAAPESGAAPAATTPATEAATASSAVAATPRPATPKATPSQPSIPSATDAIFTPQTYVIALIIIAGGIGYLVWRRRQRTLLLEATAVSSPPFAPQPNAPGVTGTRFTVELLNKLEWKRFEELVAAYYNKTGVVASRTKKGPSSAVHIRISWKGEQRPFACVQCIAHPPGLIDAQPIQALSDLLASEDVRRGYVVSAGKFGVPARDLAEEKHITLLSGDLFAEKLNALPDPVRGELMREVTAGDYITPSCPACEAKLARSPSDPSVWQCPQCDTVLPRA